jgi:hypothetical protein
MGGFVQGAVSSPPAALAGTFFFDGSTLTTVTAADGIRTCCNTIKSVSGLDVVYLTSNVSGASISGLVKGTSAYNSLISQTLAILQPTDAVFILYDQGEGDTNTSPPEDQYLFKSTLIQMHSDIVADIGRTVTSCPMIVAGLGIAPIVSLDTPSTGGGGLPSRWSNIQTQQFQAISETSGMYFHSMIAADQTDGLHYTGTAQALWNALPYAQVVNSLVGFGTINTKPWWQISGGGVVDATHTNISLVHSMGTDFTPTSGIDPFEVSGDNGATWISATGARVNATTVQLTHASISTTSVRRARYQYGFIPPGTIWNPATPPPSPSTASPNQIKDNSALTIPLNPTTWDILPTPLTTLPAPYYRGNASVANLTSQTLTGMWLGPENQQKFLIIGFVSRGTNVSSLTVTPTDVLGNPVGSATAATLVASNSTSSDAIFQCLLPTNANSAVKFNLTVVYSGAPFGGAEIHFWTAPAANLNSTTSTGNNNANGTAVSAETCTVNVSAGGFILALVSYTNQQDDSPFPVVSGTETYALRETFKEPVGGSAADASNCSANAASSFTFTGNFTVAGAPNLSVLMASWR